MALFDGVQNFTPAFTGQQLAIAAGQGAGQSISRGQATAQRGKAQKFEQDTFGKTVSESNAMAGQMQESRRAAEELDQFMGELDSHLRGNNRSGMPENEWLNFHYGQGSIIPG